MLLVDDLLMAPGKAVVALFEQLAKRAQEEFLDDAVVKQELLERLQQITQAKLQGGWAGLAALPAPTEADIADIVAFARELAPPAIDTLVLPPAPDPQVIETAAVDRAIPSLAMELAGPPRPLAIEFAGPPSEVSPAVIDTVAVASDAVRPPIETPAVESAEAPSMPVWQPGVPVPTVAAAVHPVAPALPPPPAVSEPPAVQAGAPATVPGAPPGRVTMPQAVEGAMRGLAMLKMKVSSISCVVPHGDGWQVTVELVERRGVPDTSDLLGVYETFLDAAGNVLRYERTRIRRRCDVGG
jgi:hypothetical protein